MSIICAIIKNEQKFIREWALHYLNIGFGRLYIFEDYDSDTHKEQLQDLIDEGKVVLNSLGETKFIPLDKGTIIQRNLYAKMFDMCKTGEIDAEWIGFFDSDEFLMFEDGWDLNRLEKEFENEPGILLSWKVYGANGHIQSPDGNVVDNYTTHMPEGFRLDWGLEWNVKSLVNVKNCTAERHIHVFEGCVMTNHEPLQDDLVFDKAWINHYYTKSWEDYLNRIFQRGNHHNNFRCLDKFFKCNPDIPEDKKVEMIMQQRNRHAHSTMWISRELKIISGGNIARLEQLKNDYIR